MKRLVLLLAAVLLAGCTLSAPASSVPACSGTASDPVQPSETLIYFGLPVEGYNIACQVSENGYFDFFADYEKNIGFLTRYDFADMTQHILCDKDGCLHADKTCDAYAPCWQVIALSDAVYTVDYNYAEDGETFTGTQTLVHRDADGMHPRPVSVIGDWAFFGADKKYLYGFCDGSFGRVDRTTGTETLLLHDAQQLYRYCGTFLGVWNEQFVIAVLDPDSAQTLRLDLLSTEGIQTTIARLDLGSNWPEQFACTNAARLEDTVWYLTDDVSLMGFDLSESRTLEGSKALCAYRQDDLIPTWSLHSFGGKLLAEAHIQRDGAEYPSPYLAVIAPPDGEPVEVTLKEEFRDHAEEPPPEEGPVFEPSLIRPLGEINGQLVVRCALQFFQRSFTDTTGELCFFEDHSPVYALMDPEDYFASRPVYREFSSIPNN